MTAISEDETISICIHVVNCEKHDNIIELFTQLSSFCQKKLEGIKYEALQIQTHKTSQVISSFVVGSSSPSTVHTSLKSRDDAFYSITSEHCRSFFGQ